MNNRPTTAATLLAFRAELIEGGVTEDEAHDLVRAALDAMLEQFPSVAVRPPADELTFAQAAQGVA